MAGDSRMARLHFQDPATSISEALLTMHSLLEHGHVVHGNAAAILRSARKCHARSVSHSTTSIGFGITGGVRCYIDCSALALLCPSITLDTMFYYMRCESSRVLWPCILSVYPCSSLMSSGQRPMIFRNPYQAVAPGA